MYVTQMGRHILVSRRQLAPDWAEKAQPAWLWRERRSLALYLRSYRIVIHELCKRGAEAIYLDKTWFYVAPQASNAGREEFLRWYHTLNERLSNEPLYEDTKTEKLIQGRFRQAIPNGWYVPPTINELSSWTILVEPTDMNTLYHYALPKVLTEEQGARMIHICQASYEGS